MAPAHILSTQSADLKVISKHKSAPKLTLRLVVAALSALIVVAVASATFAITYTQSLSSIQHAGGRYATAVVDVARVQLTDFFNAPAEMGIALQKVLKQPWHHLPTEDSSTFSILQKTTDYLLLASAYNPNAMTLAVIYADGSGAFISTSGRPEANNNLSVAMSNCYTLPTTGSCLARVQLYQRGTIDLLSGPSVIPMIDGRFAFYRQSLAPLKVLPALWTVILGTNTTSDVEFNLPPIFAIRNSSGYLLGMLTIPVNLQQLTSFLKGLNTTSGTHTFVIDRLLTVVATSYPTNLMIAKPLAEATGDNCIIVTDPLNPRDKGTGVCRPYAANFEWAPLAAAAQDNDLLHPEAGSSTVKRVLLADSMYFAAAAGVSNVLPSFQMTVLLLMPELDVVGDIYASRDMTLIIVAVILVVASVISIVVTGLLLKPLEQVALQMRMTSKLRDTRTDEEALSMFGEIYNLQQAYNTMNTAIHNFTRYVPREVVKELMSTGQLCEIAMTTKRCTMLFVDIASFTTMCERVPADELSRLVRTYFETMSNIVMQHDGLIDKFIGDCIMAVWGAPFTVPNQEVKATLAALLMDRTSRSASLSKEFDAAGELLSVRVGVATGDVLAGNMGSEDRMSYTVIGDAVNLAARIESLCKTFGTRVVIAEETARVVEPFFVLRLLMRVAVVGKVESKCLYEVIGLRASPQSDALHWLRLADVRQDLSESGSAASSVALSVASPADEPDRHKAVVLLDVAVATYGEDVLVSNETVNEAALFSEAVHAFTALDGDTCVKLLNRMVEDQLRMGSDLTAALLRRLCVSSSDMAFDGVWHPDGK